MKCHIITTSEEFCNVFSDDACMLFDVGEDTAGQIRRFYGDKADEIFCKLKAIFISHRHVDHHMVVSQYTVTVNEGVMYQYFNVNQYSISWISILTLNRQFQYSFQYQTCNLLR